MARYQTTRILPIILVILIIIIAVAAIVSLARVVFFSGSSNSNPAVVDTSKESLLSSGASHSVLMSVRGPIVADEKFHSYSIRVTPNTREVTTYTGYLDQKVENITLGNNVSSYEEFVYALEKADLAKGTELSGDRNDVRGICATGRVYEYSILNNGSPVKKLWTSTCKGSPGSLKASVSQLNSLFLKQIPDAEKLVKKVSL